MDQRNRIEEHLYRIELAIAIRNAMWGGDFEEGLKNIGTNGDRTCIVILYS